MCSFNKLSGDTDVAGSGSHFESLLQNPYSLQTGQDGSWGDTDPQIGQKAHQNFQV